MRRLEAARSLGRRQGASWTWKVSSGSASHEPELRPGLRLDPRVRGRARELRAEPLRLALQLDPLAPELVEPDVQLEHGDVDGDDAGEQDGEDDDPDDAAERGASPGASTAARGRERLRGRATGGDSTRRSRPSSPSARHLHGRAELRRGGARVRLELAGARPDRLPRQVAQQRLVAARRSGTPAGTCSRAPARG